MSGYTPVFDSVFTGTLCGKWPDTGLWVCLLAMADKHGVIDKTPQYISAVVGIGLDELGACLERFMQPDPHSRSGDEEGRRLVKLDPARHWGWRIVNHSKYRERARLAAKNARDVESGENALRMQDRRRPPETAADPLSNANTDSNTNEEKIGKRARARAAKRCPEEFQLDEELRTWATQNFPDVNVERETAAFRDHEYRNAKTDWRAAWRTWIRNSASFSKPNGSAPQPRKTRFEEMTEALRNATEAE